MTEQTQLPAGWVWTTLGEVADAQAGTGFPKSYQGRATGDYPFAKVSDISDAVKFNNGIIARANNYLSALDAKKIGARVFPKGTTLFAKIGEAVRLNRRAINVVPLLADNNVMGLIPHKLTTSSKYLFYFMHLIDLYEFSQATTVPSVRKSDIELIPIPLPPLAEQERIVAKIEALFSQLEAGVAALRRAQAALKRYRASLLKAACEGRLVAQDPSDEPAEAVLQRLGKSPLRGEGLPALPPGWCWVRLGEVCLSPQYGWTTSSSSVGKLHLLRTTDITPGYINWDTVPYCEQEPANPEKYLLEDGDIVISRAGSVGASLLIIAPRPAIFASYLIRFKPIINRRFVAYFLQSPSYWEAISERSLGIAIPNVNATKLKQIPFPLPPLAEQERIVAELERRLTIVAQVETAIQTGLARSARLRQAILKQAFRGEL